MLATLLLTAALALQASDTARVILVATTDVHGHVTGWDYLKNEPSTGGLARVATVVDSLRQQYPDQVVVVDAGDLIQGDPFATYYSHVAWRDPHPVMDGMNAVGYDAATPGNHEFNFGFTQMKRALAAANFPYVSGNLRVPPRDTLLYQSYTVVRRQGVRIAITGFTTPGVMVWDGNLIAGHVRVARVESSINRVLPEMRRDGDLVVVLIHSGLDGPSSYDTTGVGAENAAASLSVGASRPDVVVVGHSHREMADSVINGVHFVQPAPYAQNVAIVHVTLVRNSLGWKPVSIRGEKLSLAGVVPSLRLLRRLKEEHNTVLSWAAQAVGETSGRMRAAAARVEDTPITRFINEVQRKHAGADLSATPAFDLRGGFEEGEISMGEVVGLYPYENTLRAIRISGEQLKAYLEQSARYFYADSTGRVAVNAYVQPLNDDILNGAGYLIDLDRAPGDRIRELTFHGRPVMATDSFTLAIDSYRQAGGGNFAMLKGARVVYDRGENIRDLLIAEVRARRILHPEDFTGTDWRIVPEARARAARALFIRETSPPIKRDTLAVVLGRPNRDSLVRDSILRAQDRADSIATSTVVRSRVPLVRDNASLGLGAIVADAYRNALRADLAIVSDSELEADLPAGPITRPQLTALQPIAHHLLKLTMSGGDLMWVMEHVVEGDRPCCHLSGATVKYATERPPFLRVKEIRLPSGRHLDTRTQYTLAISDRLLSETGSFVLGGTNCSVKLGCAKGGMLERWLVERSDLTGLDAIISYLRLLPQPIVPPEDQRLVPVRR